jgi:hypothetical protein
MLGEEISVRKWKYSLVMLIVVFMITNMSEPKHSFFISNLGTETGPRWRRERATRRRRATGGWRRRAGKG